MILALVGGVRLLQHGIVRHSVYREVAHQSRGWAHASAQRACAIVATTSVPPCNTAGIAHHMQANMPSGAYAHILFCCKMVRFTLALMFLTVKQFMCCSFTLCWSIKNDWYLGTKYLFCTGHSGQYIGLAEDVRCQIYFYI